MVNRKIYFGIVMLFVLVNLWLVDANWINSTGTDLNINYLDEGLQAYWNLDGVTGEVIDLVGNNNGVNNGADRGVGGIINNSFDFELDEGDNVNLGSELDNFTDMTISLWVKPESGGGTTATIISNHFGAGEYYMIDYYNTTNKFRAYVIDNDGNSLTIETSDTYFLTNNWYYISLTFDGDTGNGTLWINNKSYSVVDASVDGVAINPDDLFLGARQNGTDRYWDGLIDEVGIWNRTLNNSEEFNLFNEGTAITYKLPLNPEISFTDETPINYANISANNFTVYANVTILGYTILNEGYAMRITIWNSTYLTEYINELEPINIWINSTYDKQFDSYTYLFDGLKAGYTFDSNASNTLIDKVTGRYNGTLQQDIALTNGVVNNSYDLTPIGLQSVSFSTGVFADEGEVNGNWSYSFWIYYTGEESSDYNAVFGEDYFHTWVQNSTLKLYINPGSEDIVSNSNVSLNEWMSIVIVCRDNGWWDIYFNGTLDKSQHHSRNNCVIPGARNWYIGKHKYSSWAFSGKIDEVYFWNRTINSSEASDVYNGFEGLSIGEELGRVTPFADSPNETFSLNSGELGDGTYYFNANFTDTNYTNYSTETREVAIDTTIPQLTLINPQNNSGFANDIIINVTAYDLNEKRTTFRLYDNETSISEEINYTDGTRNHSFLGLDEGNYYFEVRIIDEADNINTTGIQYVYIDRTIPEADLLTPINGSYTNTSATNFTVNLTDTYSTLITFVNGSGQDENADYLTNGLISYYKLDDLGDGVLDSYGSNDGTNSSGITKGDAGIINYSYNTEQVGGALFTIPNPYPVEQRQDYSFSIWFYYTDVGGSEDWQRVMNDQTAYMQLIIINSTKQFEYNPQGASYYTDVGSIPLNQWTNLIVTCKDDGANNGNFSFWVNGQLNTSARLGQSCNVGGSGRPINFIQGNWGGKVDEIAFWDKQLNTTEIQKIYANGHALTISGIKRLDTDLGHIANTTFTIKNETDDILSQNTTSFIDEPTQYIFGFIYELWYEGFYKWFFSVTDTLGQTSTSEERIVTYDITTPEYTDINGTLADGLNVSQSSIPFNLSVTDTNFANVTFVLYNDTGTTIVNQTTIPSSEWANPYLFNWTNVSDGHYWYQAIVRDLANNQNATELKSITLDITPATINQTLFGNGTEEVYIYETNTITFNFSVEDETSGITNTTIKIWDRQAEEYANITTFSSGSIYSKNISIPITLEDGEYSWKVDAYDYADNYADPEENITIDTENPELYIISPANNTGYTTGSFTVNVYGYDLTEELIEFRLFEDYDVSTTSNTSSPYKINVVSGIVPSTIQYMNDSNQVTYGNNSFANWTDPTQSYTDMDLRNISFDLPNTEISGTANLIINFTSFEIPGTAYSGDVYSNVWHHCYNWSSGSLVLLTSFSIPTGFGNHIINVTSFPEDCISPIEHKIDMRWNLLTGYGGNAVVNEIWLDYSLVDALQYYSYDDGTRSQLFSGLAEGDYYFDVRMTDGNGRTNTTDRYRAYVDLTAPEGESGGFGGSGTSPINNTYTNQSGTNFTVNVSDEGGIGNVTLTIVNESDDIINVTTIDFPDKPTNLFFGIIYYLWYEGFYKWYYTIYDAVGFSTTTTEAMITYDITDPNAVITYPQNTTYNFTITNLTYNYDEINCNDTWLEADTTYYGDCGTPYTGLTSVEENNTWILHIRDKAGNVNDSSVTFTQDTTPPTVEFTSNTQPNGTSLGNDVENIYVEVNYTEPVDLYSITYQLSKQGVGVVSTDTYNTLPLPIAINWTGLTDGEFYYYAYVCDLYGNCNATETRTIFLDNVPPVIEFPAGQTTNYSTDEFPINITFDYNVSDTTNLLRECWYNIDIEETNGTYTNYVIPSSISNATGTLLDTTRNETSRWFMYSIDSFNQTIYEVDIATGSLIRSFVSHTHQYNSYRGTISYYNNQIIIAGQTGCILPPDCFYPVSYYYANGTLRGHSGTYGYQDAVAGEVGINEDLYYELVGGSYVSIWNITTRNEHIIGECGGDNRSYFTLDNVAGTPFYIYNGYMYGLNGSIMMAYNYTNLTCNGVVYEPQEIPQFNMSIQGISDLLKTSIYRSEEYDLQNYEMWTSYGNNREYDADYLLYYNGYKDFVECSSTATAPFYHDGITYVSVYGMDIAGNVNYSTLDYYILYHEYTQSSNTGENVVEGQVVQFELNVTMTDETDTSAEFVYNGVSYPADSYNIIGDKYQFIIDFTIPDGAGNLSGKPANWFWNYSIENFVDGYETETQNQTVYAVDIDDCSTYDAVALNLIELNDEATDTLMNASLNPVIDVEVTLVSQGDESVTWEYSTQFNDSTGQICIPSIILNYTDYYIYTVIGFNADTYVREFWYLDKGNLSKDEFYLDDFTTRNVTLRDLLTDDSTSFLFTYYSEDYNLQPNAIVTVLRKYIDEGVFKEVERGKMDDNGQTHVHLVQEDVIYKFRVTLDGELLYTSGEYNAKCIETPCQISLQAGNEPLDVESEWDNLDEGTYSISTDRSNRNITLTFNLNETGNMSFSIYAIGGSGYELVDSDTTTSKTGTITLYVPQTYDNQTYLASVRHNGMYVTDEMIDLSRSAYDIFGPMGLLLGALLVLTLGLIAVSQGPWTIIFIIVGLLVSVVAHLVDMDIYTLMWLISAGALIVWKLSSRRTL